MPARINMLISNNNPSPVQQRQFIASMPVTKAPSALNAPFIARVHNVRPGCGSCGRH